MNDITERLEYSEQDVKKIVDRVSNGTYSRTDVLETLKEGYGIAEEEGIKILEEYDKTKVTSSKPVKIKPKRERSLEAQVVNEELQNIKKGIKEYAPKVTRGILKTITYPIGTSLAFPTIIKKAIEWDKEDGFDILATGWTILGFVIGTGVNYLVWGATNPKLILPIALTQIATNTTSGIYEYIRHVKKRATEKRDNPNIN